MTSDDRMTWGLIGEILDALERHGYHQYDNRHTAQAVGAIADLADVYDGTRNLPYETYLYQSPPAGPGPSAPETGDAVILTDAEVSTVATALDVAAGHNRDRAAACADCADQNCLTCQSRLRDAQAYAQMAAQMLQTAEAARAANSYQPEPGIPPDLSVQSYPVADKEAGQ